MMMTEVDRDQSGEIGYMEFLEVMTPSIERTKEEAVRKGALPFSVVATSYRRKKLIEGLISDKKEIKEHLKQLAKELKFKEQGKFNFKLKLNCAK